MVDDENVASAGETDNPDDELGDPDFQFVLKELLATYKPLLKEDLDLAGAPKKLEQEARDNPPDCAKEFAAANELFGKFLTEEVAIRLLPEDGRRLLGPIEQWRWCFSHLRCCIIFGWLVCRGPRTFRGFN